MRKKGKESRELLRSIQKQKTRGKQSRVYFLFSFFGMSEWCVDLFDTQISAPYVFREIETPLSTPAHVPLPKNEWMNERAFRAAFQSSVTAINWLS